MVFRGTWVAEYRAFWVISRISRGHNEGTCIMTSPRHETGGIFTRSLSRGYLSNTLTVERLGLLMNRWRGGDGLEGLGDLRNSPGST